MARPPALGVGLTYWPRLRPFVEAYPESVDVLEFQPETVWLPPRGPGEACAFDALALDAVTALPHPKIAHGVGFPVGGARRPDPAHVPPLREVVGRLGAPWVSEHLAVNTAGGPDGDYCTAFLLPPCQTPDAAATAGRHAREVAEALGRPFAVEPGVSYLQPRPGELADGEYVAAVLAESGCGLLLDLHNVWTNARNGRQPVEEFLAQVPLDRVWEVHVAGGSEHDGYWLDAHSDVVPEPVMGLARDVLPDLPNVGALVFELLPMFYDGVGPDRLRAQLDALREVWALRRPGAAAVAPAPVVSGAPAAPTAWDDTLGAAVVGRPVPPGGLADVAGDPGVRVLAMLLGELRGSMVARALKLTTRLLLLHLGEEGMRALLARYWATAYPQLFAVREAEGFAAFLRAEGPRLPHLAEVVAFELALMDAVITDRDATIVFTAHPDDVLGALAAGRLPEPAATGAYPVVVSPG